jgi:hypothetical protein
LHRERGKWPDNKYAIGGIAGIIETGCAMLEQSPGKRLAIRPLDRTRVAIVAVVLIRKRKAL